MKMKSQTVTNSATKQVIGARVTWQADHEQYWRGHSVTFSDYDECATGCGETLREAFEDALEQLAEQDIRLDESCVRAQECVAHGLNICAQCSDADQWRDCANSWCGMCEACLLAELASDVRDGDEGLDVDIVAAYCDAQGKHVTTQEHAADCECGDCDTEEVEDESPDCAVCAGEWHFYVSVDVRFADEESRVQS